MARRNQKNYKQEMKEVAPRDNAMSIQKKIALRAYELYLQRGEADGHAEEDWLQAEQEILSNQER